MKDVIVKPVLGAMGSETDDHTLVEGYMCMTDFECELGMACGGNVVYPSVEDIKRNRKCVESCGIVKVAVICTEIVQESTMYEEFE